MPRFSDSKLEEFHTEFKELESKFEAHRMEQQDLHNELLTAIRDNTKAVASLAHRTESIIEAWEASQGAIKVFRVIGSIVKWVSGIGVAIAAAWIAFKNGWHQ